AADPRHDESAGDRHRLDLPDGRPLRGVDLRDAGARLRPSCGRDVAARSEDSDGRDLLGGLFIRSICGTAPWLGRTTIRVSVSAGLCDRVAEFRPDQLLLDDQSQFLTKCFTTEDTEDTEFCFWVIKKYPPRPPCPQW